MEAGLPMMKPVQILMTSSTTLFLVMSGFRRSLVLDQSLAGISTLLDIQIQILEFMQKWAMMPCFLVGLITKRRRNAWIIGQ